MSSIVDCSGWKVASRFRRALFGDTCPRRWGPAHDHSTRVFARQCKPCWLGVRWPAEFCRPLVPTPRASASPPFIANCATALPAEGCLWALSDFVVVTCEHGGNRVPAAYIDLFRHHQRLLNSHRGYDPGALELARACARRLKTPLHFATVTRLLVELNRSIGHRSHFSVVTRSLGQQAREALVKNYYLPYRQRVETEIAAAIAAKCRAIHFSMHTFTPLLDGQVRNADVGLLYDPRRSDEVAICAALRRNLA